MNEQMNILLEVLEEIKQQNRELKASVSNLASQPISTTTSSEEDGISLTDVARLIGQKIEIDGKFKSELTVYGSNCRLLFSYCGSMGQIAGYCFRCMLGYLPIFIGLFEA